MNIKKIASPTLLTLSIAAVATVSTALYLSNTSPDNTTQNTQANHSSLITESQQSSVNTDTTKQILGFVSKHGALPSSLRGTTLDNALQVDENGNLLISSDIKDVFDYFLSSISEEDLDTILLRVDEYLNHYLQEPALSDAKAILAQYIEYKSSLMALEQEMGEDLAQMSKEDKINGGYLDFLRRQMDQRNGLREQFLDANIYEAFYAEEQQYDEYTYSKLLVTSDQSLSANDRFEKISALQMTLPDHVQESIKETQITDELKLRTEKVLANGGGQQEIQALRREMFGEEAVQRFDALDQQRAEWKSRINAYLSQRAGILNNQGLAKDELSAQVDILRASLFDEREQIRVRSIERHAEV